MAAVASSATTTFTTLLSFDNTNGANPQFGSLVQGFDGNFYGTTYEGGANGYGTVFKITSTGTLTALHSFASTDGAYPYAGVVQGIDGNFYGTTYGGGANGDGTVFKITPTGTLTTLHSFAGTDGEYPVAGLVQASNGNFYGTTYGGGANEYGTVFEITPGGTLTMLHSFTSASDSPQAGLILATDGTFYGTTSGANGTGYGTVFQITGSGTLTTLHNFEYTDGAYPFAGLVQGADGNFYGTTAQGGTNGYGTVFQITPGGTLTTLHSFAEGIDGGSPFAGLVQATNGNLYGTTYKGGANGYGVVFQITTGGTLTTLHSFDATDGEYTGAGLEQATSGTFYGTTPDGGANGYGTIFSLSVGLGPFVETLPLAGKVGGAVIVLGTNLTGATSVSFNGTAATFTVVSASEITTAVPPGATTGRIQVITPNGTFNSNAVFRVMPQILSFTPPSGPVGTVVTITGVSLTQTKQVTFGGVPATSFTVNSDIQVTATVPTGAQTGRIIITTAGGTAISATPFGVTQ